MPLPRILFSNLVPPIMNKTNTTSISTSIIRIIALAFFAQIFLSLNLWFPTDRVYPVIPYFSWLDFKLGDLGTAFFSGLFVLFLGMATFEHKFQKQLLILALSCLGLLMLEDVNRFQAWVYIYATLLSVIAYNFWKIDAQKLLSSLQFVLAMIYFWTGIQKLNVQFINDVYPWLMGIFSWTAPLVDYKFLGYGIGIFELLLGCSLLFRRTAKWAVIMGLFLHLGILILLIKDQWNSVVYPWNVAMVLLLVVLFWKQEANDSKTILSNTLPHYAILFLFGFVPLLDMCKLAPHGFGLGMYSGTTMECDLIFDDAVGGICVPQKLQEHLLYKSPEESKLSVDDWGTIDLNVPPFASLAVYRQVAKEFCACSVQYDGYVEFEMPYRWKDADTIISINCKELLEE